jgi:hypothetical protein
MKRPVEIAAAAAALSLIAWSAGMPAFAPPPRAPGIAKTRCVSAFAEGWATAKEGEVRARARRALRLVSLEEETLVRNLADAAESFPSIEAADLNPLMERIRSRIREPLFPGPICRSNSTNTSGSTKLTR